MGRVNSGSRKLPPPDWDRLGPLSESLLERRSVRSYSTETITEEDLSLLLASACGISDPVNGLRTAPSGGATYPLDLYVVSETGVEEYVPEDHSLVVIKEGDTRSSLAHHSYRQSFIARAPVTFVICADYPRITSRYRDRGIRYAILEAGHIAQNIHLACVSLGYGSVAVGAYDDDDVANALGIEGRG
ncbi:MAG: SagB/ThcOx family dehydrogenase, partial [bacterium]